jgi:hypothetical protein
MGRGQDPDCFSRSFNLAWMWGALLAATMAAWLHQLTAITRGEDIVHGHGVRGGKAMTATGPAAGIARPHLTCTS